MAELALMGLGFAILWSYVTTPRKGQGAKGNLSIPQEADEAPYKFWADVKAPLVFGSLLNERYAGQLNQDVDIDVMREELLNDLNQQQWQQDIDETNYLLDEEALRGTRRNPSLRGPNSIVLPDLQMVGGEQDMGRTIIIEGAPDYTKPGVVPIEVYD